MDLRHVFGLALLFALPAWGANDDPFSRPHAFDAATSQLTLNREIESNERIAIDEKVPLVSATVEATIELPKPTSLVRILLQDSAGRDHLVYEAYPVLSGETKIDLKAACEETCVLPGVTAVALRVQVDSARVTLKSVGLSSLKGASRANLEGTAKQWKHRQQTYKVASLNANIASQGLRWTAGTTAISAMSYSEKKSLFGGRDVPNLQGFEYYRSGIFDLAPTSLVESRRKNPHHGQSTGDFPESWNWRSAHGADWVTPVRNQAQCGSCWAFGATAALETAINLYYNQHLDIDLAEQDMVSCADLGGCSGALPSDALDYVKNNGMAEESCFPYKAYEVSCSRKCSDWYARSWKVESYGIPDTDDDTLKQTIYRKGVIGFGISSWGHEMAAVGYKPDSRNRQRTLWIIKNSWGANWGDKGYTTMSVYEGDRAWDVYVDHPYLAVNPNQYQPACVDEGNGQCYWGLSPTKPASCPATCKN